MKKINIIFIIAMMFALTLVCHAKTADEIISEANEFYSDDIKAVSDLINENSEYYESMLDTIEKSDDSVACSFKTARPTYIFNYPYNIDNVEEITDFEAECLSDFYYITVFADNGYTSFRKDNGKWEWSSSGGRIAYSDVNGDIVEADESYEGRVRVAFDKLDTDKIITVKVANDGPQTRIIYVRTTDEEYVIPFTNKMKGEEIGIETGKVYTATEFLKSYTIERITIKEEDIPEGSTIDMYGGGSAHVTVVPDESEDNVETNVDTDISQQGETSTEDVIVSDGAEPVAKRSAAPEYVIYIAVAVGVLVIAVVVFAVIRKKRIK